MYRISVPPPLPPGSRQRVTSGYAAVDSERGAVVGDKYVDKEDPSCSLWYFQNRDTRVAFTTVEEDVDRDGRSFKSVTLTSFPAPIYKPTASGLSLLTKLGLRFPEQFVFENDDQKTEWTLLAVEGLLAFEEYSLRKSTRRAKVHALGRDWMIEDFNYAEGDFRVDL